MPSRPYFRLSLQELDELHRAHLHDRPVLKAILDELRHRTTARAAECASSA